LKQRNFAIIDEVTSERGLENARRERSLIINCFDEGLIEDREVGHIEIGIITCKGFVKEVNSHAWNIYLLFFSICCRWLLNPFELLSIQ